MRKEQRQKRMREAVAKLQAYMSSYSEQAHYEDYTDKTYVDDILYGLGLSLSGLSDFSGPGGYSRFKAYLQDHLDGRVSTKAGDRP